MSKSIGLESCGFLSLYFAAEDDISLPGVEESSQEEFNVKAKCLRLFLELQKQKRQVELDTLSVCFFPLDVMERFLSCSGSVNDCPASILSIYEPSDVNLLGQYHSALECLISSSIQTWAEAEGLLLNSKKRKVEK
jgi:hypothetical protein